MLNLKAASVTIVIPSHNRYGKLRALLESIQKTHPKEVDSIIVVDDSDNPIELATDFPTLNLKQKMLRERVFISKAKNIGWKDSETEFVFFIDDDNVLDNETVPRVYDVITSMPNVAAVMPAVLYKSRPDLVWVYAAQFLKSGPRFNLIGRNVPRNESLEGRLLVADALPNAFIVRRGALEAVGGFDERLVVNSSMDLSTRLKLQGWQVVSYTGSFIYHDVEPPGKIGWWASHGAADPDRVRYELRDWILIMHMIHGKERFFALHAAIESSRFVIPNLLAYILRSKSRRRLVFSLAKGYIEGIRLTL